VKAINPINSLQEFVVSNGLGHPKYFELQGVDLKWEVRCTVGKYSVTAWDVNCQNAKIKSAHRMLEMVTEEKFELKIQDDYDGVLCKWQEIFSFLRPKLLKRSKEGLLLHMGVHEHDEKSSFELIAKHHNYLLQKIDASFQDFGVNSHCPFFEFVVTAKITVCFKNKEHSYFTNTFSEKGIFRLKKVSEKIAYTKLVTTFAKTLERLVK